jgi:ferritin
MISTKMQDAINAQIKAELESAYLYLSMSAYFQNANLSGFAHWMRLQSKEELEHAMKFYDYLLERGADVTLLPINQPEIKFTSAEEVFDKTYKHEQLVTSLINKLYELAVADKDYPSQILLQWYINEQVEEEANASQILATLKMIENKPHSLLALDHQMAKRGSD